ncbi:MAG: spermidine synthase [Dehalococcoidia bacterium]
MAHEPPRHRSALWRGVFVAVTFVSSFLIFLVQPIGARLILPWFGGSASVWITSLLFFQVMLLAGYLYSHVLATWLSGRRQALLHVAALAAAALLLPILPPDGLRPSGVEAPVWRVLLILATTVGAPYLLLATASPLLQRWYSMVPPARPPYVLYAVSNAGALAGLLTYPTLVEPLVGLRMQAYAWSVAYVLAAASIALLAWRFGRQATVASGAVAPSGLEFASEEGGPGARDGLLTRGRALLVVALAATGTAHLGAATASLSNDVAGFPFLWVTPLAIYLATWIVAFFRDRLYDPVVFGGLFAAAAYYALYLQTGPFLTLSVAFALHAFVVFAGCMVVHGEAARIRPAPRHLTTYYVAVALGGALGGSFVAVAAPLLFPGGWDLQVGVAAVALLFLIARQREWRFVRRLDASTLRRRGAIGVTAMLLLVGAQIVLTTRADGDGVRYRNFYGVVTVQPDVDLDGRPMTTLVHSGTLHGSQYDDPSLAMTPTAYYTETSGAGIALTSHAEMRTRPLRVAVVGLGTGTLAAYARNEEHWMFIDVNPLVPEIATDRFSYLADARGRGATVDVVIGDARLVLEDTAGEDLYDVLVLDAFSGDAIPAHLLTVEAFEMYRERLAAGGVIAVHISNRHLALWRVLRPVAREAGLASAYRDDRPQGPAALHSTWVLLAETTVPFEAGLDAGVLEPIPDDGADVLWTDDHHDLWRVLAGLW